jgi:hypothetical protein
MCLLLLLLYYRILYKIILIIILYYINYIILYHIYCIGISGGTSGVNGDENYYSIVETNIV